MIGRHREAAALLLAAFIMLLVCALFMPRSLPQTLAPQKAEGQGVTRVGGLTLIDVNSADAPLLSALPGIGETLAGRIVDYRTAHGPFSSLAGLDAVKGIGPAKIAAITDRACVQQK